MSHDCEDTLSQRLLWSTNPNKHKSTVKSLRRKPVMQSEAATSGQMHVCHHLTPCVFQYFSEAGHADTLRKQKWLFKQFQCDKRRGKCVREGVNLWTPLPDKQWRWFKICVCTMQSVWRPIGFRNFISRAFNHWSKKQWSKEWHGQQGQRRPLQPH